ncbi:MAG: ABC transporter ATP-binding protein [Armatimonadetes bacterium]|nr:ABC transporter ATP-binding protein [Armatimonadota bacterium]
MLRMEAVTKRFGAVTALDGVDFEVRAGEVHALLGENGAGKSTLMHILSGLYRPGSGVVCLDGQPVAIHSPQDAARLGIGMVHQHFMLVPVFTVAENIALAASGSARGWLNRAEMRENVSRLARRLDWEVDPDAPVIHLPVGAQQRVEILKALQTDARLLIFDEPTAVLAPQEIEELFEVFRRLRGEGRSLIFISHKLNEVMAICDRVTVLRRGRKIGTVPTAQTSPAGLAEMMVGSRSSEEESSHAPRPESDSRPAVLSVRNLTSADRQNNPALKGVSLEVRQGEIFGIAGVDGNGQPELAEALSGLARPTGGEIALKGVPVRHLTPDRLPQAGIACIPQDRQRTGLVLGMTVADNLVLEAHRERDYRCGPFLNISSLRRLAASLVEEFDIRTPGLDIAAASLSGGNQQKIVIARALRRRPDLLVAVNPTRGLDIGATEYVHRKMLEAREAGTAVLLISTELDEVLALSDRVGVMYAGRLMGIVPPDIPRDRIGLMIGGREAP